jgi:hypothetical protein
MDKQETKKVEMRKISIRKIGVVKLTAPLYLPGCPFNS